MLILVQLSLVKTATTSLKSLVNITKTASKLIANLDAVPNVNDLFYTSKQNLFVA